MRVMFLLFLVTTLMHKTRWIDHLPNVRQFVLAFLPAFSISVTGLGQGESEEKPELTLYGFGRANFVWDNQELGRSDIFVPANINVGGTRHPEFFLGAKQTRFGIDFKEGSGPKGIKAKLEVDFHNDASDATGLIRMREAYVSYRFFLAGMTWSNFFDIDVNPVTVDFEGPNSSTLSRTPQLRFFAQISNSVLSLSLENPLEAVMLGGSITTLPERFPDLVTAYRINGAFGFVKIAGLLREIRYESDMARSLYGYGLTAMTSLKIGERDKLKFQGVIGTGVAQYIQGAVGLHYDAVYNGTNELETLQMRGSNISFQHHWNDRMHSSLTGGWLGVEDNVNLLPTDYKLGFYGSVNLFWDPVKNLTFGGEVVLGERVNMNRASDNAFRMQMNATYRFSKVL